MIRNANGYRFTTVPFTGEIKGLIVPTADGTASEKVIRLENVCYLTEMARETGYWADPQPNKRAAPNWVGSYDVNKRIIYKSVLDEVADTARLQFGVTSRISHSGSVGVIPMGWTNPQLPIIRLDSGAWDELTSTMVLPRCSVGNLPYIPETLNLRRSYYDFSQMRRFLLEFMDLPSTSPHLWSDYVAAMSAGDEFAYHHGTGPFVRDDGQTSVTEFGQTTSVAGYLPSSFSQGWDASGSVSYTKSVTASLAVVINAYYYRQSLTSGIPYLANSLNGWIVINGEARTKDGVGRLYTAVFPITLTFASVVSRTSPFYGVGQAIYNTDYGTQMPQFFSLINSWMSTNIPDWDSKREWLSATAVKVYGDSGKLTLPTEIESTGWAWRP